APHRLIYRLSCRRPEPDFRLVLVGNPDPSVTGCTVRQGSSQDLLVVCYRRDGFDGEVNLELEGLPAGVTCPPQVLGPKQEETRLVVTAAADAPAGLSEIKIKGTATIDGKP